MNCELRKVALYFGSFNPIHKGHIGLGEYLLEHADVDELWYVVSPQLLTEFLRRSCHG